MLYRQRSLPRCPYSSFTTSLNMLLKPTTFLEQVAGVVGPDFSLDLIGLPQINHVTSRDAIGSIASDDGTIFDTGRASLLLGSFEDVFGRSSVPLLDGTAWKERRDWITDAMPAPAIVRALNSTRADIATAIGRWPSERTFPLYPALRRVGARVAVRFVLGLTNDDLDSFVGQISALLDCADDTETWLLDHKKLLRPIDERVRELIKARSARRGDDMLSRLIRDQKPWMSEDVLRDACVTMTILGHEGSSVTLAWALYHLITQRDMTEYVENEVKYLAGANPLTIKDLRQKTPRIEHVLKETLRLYPPLLGANRITKARSVVCGCALEENSVVSTSSFAAQRRGSVWPNPDVFVPNRFATAKPERKDYFPFGLPPRTCPGMQFANLTMKVLLADIWHAFGPQLRMPAGYRAQIRRRGNVIAPSEDLPCVRNP